MKRAYGGEGSSARLSLTANNLSVMKYVDTLGLDFCINRPRIKACPAAATLRFVYLIIRIVTEKRSFASGCHENKFI